MPSAWRSVMRSALAHISAVAGPGLATSEAMELSSEGMAPFIRRWPPIVVVIDLVTEWMTWTLSRPRPEP